MWAALALSLVIAFSPTITNLNAKSNIQIQETVKQSVSVYWWEKAPSPKSRNGTKMPESWWNAVKQGSKRWGSNPFDIASLMDIEMNGYHPENVEKQKRSKRKYLHPCGFYRKCNIPEYVKHIPEYQIDWACMRLSNDLLLKLSQSNSYKKLKELQKQVLSSKLKIYNVEWKKNNYIPDVIANSKRMETEAWEIVHIGNTIVLNK
jgi:hypothetical protein